MPLRSWCPPSRGRHVLPHQAVWATLLLATGGKRLGPGTHPATRPGHARPPGSPPGIGPTGRLARLRGAPGAARPVADRPPRRTPPHAPPPPHRLGPDLRAPLATARLPRRAGRAAGPAALRVP